MERYRDPDCTCTTSYRDGRIRCTSCRARGPLPGSLADPDMAKNLRDPGALRQAAELLAARVAVGGPYTFEDRRTLVLAGALRREADRLDGIEP